MDFRINEHMTPGISIDHLHRRAYKTPRAGDRLYSNFDERSSDEKYE